MVDAWITCVYCAARYDASLQRCPKCKLPKNDTLANNFPNEKKVHEKAKPKGFGRKYIIFGIIACVVAALSFIIILAPNYPHPYVSKAYGFSYDYPQDWNFQENVKEESDGEVQNTLVTFYNSEARIDVIAEDKGDNSFEQFLNDKKQENIQKFAQKYNLVYTADNDLKVNGYDGHYTEKIITANGMTVKIKSVAIPKDNMIYIITFSTQADKYDELVTSFNWSINSFKFT